MPQDSIQQELEKARREEDPREVFRAASRAGRGGQPRFTAPPLPEFKQEEPQERGIPNPLEHPFDFATGLTKNTIDDAFGILKGLYQIIPTAFKAAYDIAKDPEGLSLVIQNPSFLAKAYGDSAVALKDAIIEPYQKYGLKVGYHKPITTLLDLLAVNGIVAQGAKHAGRLAGKSGEKLVELATKLEKLPSELARKTVDASVKKVTGGRLDLAKRREYLHIKGEEAAQVPLKIAKDYDEVGQKVAALTDEEAALWDKWRKLGYSNADAAAFPKVAEALESYRGLASTWQAELKKRKPDFDAVAVGALEKKFAAEMGWGVDDAAKAKAREAMKGMDRQPVYGPAIFEKKGLDIGEMVDRLIDMSKSSKGGKADFLEEFTGKEGAIKDPRKYVPEAIKNFREVEGRLRFDERIIQEYGSGIIGKEKLPMGVPRKHFDDTMRERAFDSIADPTIKRLLKLERNLAGDPVRVVLGVYDRILNIWRRMATGWNPAYYTGNVIGDAVLGTLGGSDWLKAQKLVAQGAMPPQGMAKVGMAPSGGYVEKLKDIANSADQAARAGLITRQVANAITENAAKFEKAGYSLDSILRSTQQLSDTQVQMQLLQEHIARTDRRVAKADQVIEGLLQQEKRLADRIESITSKVEQPRAVAKVNPLRPTSKPDAVRDFRHFVDDVGKPGFAIEVPKGQSPNDVAARYATLRGPDGKVQGILRFSVRSESTGVFPHLGIETRPGYENALSVFVAPKFRRKGIATKLYDYAKSQGFDVDLVSGKAELTPLGAAFATARKQRGATAAPAIIAQSPQVEALNRLRQRIVNVTKMRDDMVRDLTDDTMRASNMEARIPGLKEQNDVVRQAVAHSNDFIGNYLGLDGFEQGVMRRIIPFYPFVKAMNMLAFKLPFIAPVKTFLWHRYAMTAWSMVGDPELPEWVQGYVPVFARENGDMVWVRATRYSPFEGLRSTKIGDVPVPGAAALQEQNPFIGLAFRYVGGKTVFDKSGIPYGEPMVNISNGEVYEFQEDGTLKKVVSQTPLIAGLVNFFPITQYIRDALTPYVSNKYNWVGFPEPVINPDGTYKYPRELWERALSVAGVKAMGRSREDLIAAEKVKVRQAISSVKSAYKRASPEEQKMMEEILEDYSRGEYQRITR